jgi:uncharacterized membrane protein YdbT with pleckstrin-like domain
MSYADGLLSSGERVVHREKQHWWVFVWGARFTILAVILAAVLGVLSTNLGTDGISGTARTVITWVVAGLFIGGLALLFWTTLRYMNQEYVLTNRRVIQVEGVVNKRAVDSSLEKINDAVLTQSIFGRALGFGDLSILTASEAAISDFKMLVRPIEFKKAMLEAKHEYEREVAGGNAYDPPAPPLRSEAPAAPVAAAAAPAAAAQTQGAPVAAPGPIGDETVATTVPGTVPPAGAGSDDLTRTLASLADLRDRGAISTEEYERKKAEILGRL